MNAGTNSSTGRRRGTSTDTVADRLQLNPDWAKLPLFDRKGWTKVRFGDVVRVLKEQVDPVADGVERYVAGEHMETENVHIRTWGTVGDGYLGPAFIRGFRKGQVLYGSRRTYLKKVAVAGWDGVTANTTLVLEAVEGKLRQALLPWLMLSERFTRHSVQESKGSTNPYINWPDIAKFEFDLPPLDQQRRLTEILWAVDEAIQNISSAAQVANSVIDAELNEFLYHKSKWRLVETRDLLTEGTRNGFSPPARENSGRVPTLSISAIRGGLVVPEGSVKYADVNPDDVQQFLLRCDDILVVRGNGNRLLCGRAGVVREFPKGCFYPDLLIRLRFRPDCLLPDFAVQEWNEPTIHTRLLKRAKSTNGIWKVNNKDVQTHQLFVPPLIEQKQFLERIKTRTEVARAFERSANDATNLQTALINTLV